MRSTSKKKIPMKQPPKVVIPAAVPEFQIVKFSGAIYLKDWLHHTDGRAYMSVAGIISILNATSLAGFELGSREANWVARVQSQDGTKSMNILGCQIRAVSNVPQFKKLEMNTLHVESL